jgi:segregation and condensation protein B
MSELKYLRPDLPALLEALLFTASEAVYPSQLASALNISVAEVEQGLIQLGLEIESRHIRIQRSGGKIQLTTDPTISHLVENFLGLEATTRLSRAALETLAIVAYQQPVTRPYLEGIRGISSDGVLKSLLGKGLIQEIGRADGPGRPILYGTTSDFLLYFGVGSLADLPPLNLPDPRMDNKPDEMLKG